MRLNPAGMRLAAASGMKRTDSKNDGGLKEKVRKERVPATDRFGQRKKAAGERGCDDEPSAVGEKGAGENAGDEKTRGPDRGTAMEEVGRYGRTSSRSAGVMWVRLRRRDATSCRFAPAMMQGTRLRVCVFVERSSMLP